MFLSMQALLEKHSSVHSENLPNLNEPSVEFQVSSAFKSVPFRPKLDYTYIYIYIYI